MCSSEGGGRIINTGRGLMWDVVFCWSGAGLKGVASGELVCIIFGDGLYVTGGFVVLGCAFGSVGWRAVGFWGRFSVVVQPGVVLGVGSVTYIILYAWCFDLLGDVINSYFNEFFVDVRLSVELLFNRVGLRWIVGWLCISVAYLLSLMGSSALDFIFNLCWLFVASAGVRDAWGGVYE
ncbi:hypothetical protein Tco_1378650 [Tanacetum coccineum]